MARRRVRVQGSGLTCDSSLRKASNRPQLKKHKSLILSEPLSIVSPPPLLSQERLVSRLLEDADGFNDKGEPTGEEPAGVWAEIVPYGGAGANSDNAR